MGHLRACPHNHDLVSSIGRRPRTLSTLHAQEALAIVFVHLAFFFVDVLAVALFIVVSFTHFWLGAGRPLECLGNQDGRWSNIKKLSPKPPAQPLPLNAVHIRVTAALCPAKGRRPPKAAWAIAVDDLDERGHATERMSAAGAIATVATHGPGHPGCQAACHTWQTAHQAAVAKGLISAAQHRRRRRPIVLTVHNVTTARDLQSPQATRPPRRTSHQHLARNNFSTLQELNAQPGVTVTLRVDAGPPPARLQHAAEQAAHLGDLRSMHPTSPASRASAQWDELRVWDPGD